MREDQSGSENQQPEYVGPWSPPPVDDAGSPPEAGDAGSSPSDAGPARPDDTAPLTGSPGASDQPSPPSGQPGGYAQGGFGAPQGYPGYGQPGGYGAPGAGQPGGYGAPGAGQPGGYGAPQGYPGHGQPGGYAQGGYGQPGADQPGGYGRPGSYAPPGGYPAYGQPGYGQGGYGHPADYIEQQPRGGGKARSFLVYLVVAALAAGVGAGAVAALDHSTNAAQNSPSVGAPVNPGSGNGFNPNSGGSGQGNGSNSGGGVSSSQERAIAGAVEPGVVDIQSNLQYVGGTAEATGMVISSNGLVLTNNHVIVDTTGLTATLVSTGQKFTAKWLGYDKTDDVSVIQLQNASGLRTVPLGNSSTVKQGESVVAIGNAEGVGGQPTVVTGSITQLDQTITASDDLGGSETLHGMLQTNANIQEGDSGGPLVSSSGKVIGMDTAASSGSFGNQSGSTVGFAIPINRALSIAHQIINGQSSSTVKIGPSGFIGVLVPSQRASTLSSPQQQQQQQSSQQSGNSGLPSSGQQCLANDQNAGVPRTIAPVGSGTLILGTLCGTPAASVGITAGDVITKVDGHAVTSPNSLSAILQGYRPGVTVSVTWVDTSGGQHTSQMDLLPDPPA